jgi:hypothetical protein
LNSAAPPGFPGVPAYVLGKRAKGHRHLPPRKTLINWEVEDMTKLVWEMIEAEPAYRKIERAKVPGGWLVRMEVGGSGGGITFVPDPNHEWE